MWLSFETRYVDRELPIGAIARRLRDYSHFVLSGEYNLQTTTMYWDVVGRGEVSSARVITVQVET